MSYDEFRKRIDTARQILVGAVPSPAGQIDQITYALMYKFMNDIDDQAAAYGSKRTYFVGDYAKYNWHTLMNPGLEAHDQLELYRQAIQGMGKNPNLPALFRDIYQNAFLPFNSPNVLRLFLEEINKFSHSDSDDIGDAYEYLLSITGAQGDVGQFRTPRHIIKFIVEAVNPTKTDKVLDPAVGTAGFLIAAYNHVKSQHDGVDERGEPNEESHLSADELDKLHHNYRGFDIDPTMVRTASVNLYLHGFTLPDIRNHDSLSDEKYWEDRYDVIFANPPFMTPKGGIQPHKKFSLTANRAEVLFVDYIASHINPVSGRAGIIIPEGIIFQSGKAYKELRKNLVENYLYAVVSLPAGVFQPYSGVKTSILLLDKQLAGERDNILFVKVENDGYSLGAQRRRDVINDQLPQSLASIRLYQGNYPQDNPYSHTVSRKLIAETGDYSLSGDRYKVDSIAMSSFPLVTLNEVLDVRDGTHDSPKYVPSGYPLVTSKNLKHGMLDFRDVNYISKTDLESINRRSKVDIGDVLVPMIGTIGGAVRINQVSCEFAIKNVALIKPKSKQVDMGYVFHVLNSQRVNSMFTKSATGGTQKFISLGFIRKLNIPLPPIEVQRQIVAELDGYQKIIDAAKTIVRAYRPELKVDPKWGTVRLGELIRELEAGVSVNSENRHKEVGEKGVLKTSAITYGHFKPQEHKTILKEELKRAKIHPRHDNIIISRMNTPLLVGASAYVDEDWDDLYLPDRLWQTVRSRDDFSMKFVFQVISSPEYRKRISEISGGTSGSMKNISKKAFLDIKIPLPKIETQREIVAKLEIEQTLIDANKKLIETFQQKIKDKLSEIWGE